MKIGISAAVLVAGMAVPAMAQMTGVSHPEQVPITISPDTPPPPVYIAPPPATTPVVTADPTPALSASFAAPTVSNDPKLTARPGIAAPDPDANIVARVPGPANQLPIGTTVKVRMKEELSTKTTIAGTAFTAELVAPVLRDGRVLLPAGSTLTGRVTEVHGGKRISGQASMHLMTQQVTLPDGTIYPIQAQVIDTDLYKATKVDSEGTILHKGPKTGTAASIGISTGAGAASGALLGGWPGAIIGAGVGAGVSTIVWLKQDRQAALPEGTNITFMLTQGLLVGEK
jgi:hypothetical protein